MVWAERGGAGDSQILSSRVRASDGVVLDSATFRVDARYADILPGTFPIDIGDGTGLGTGDGGGTVPPEKPELILESTNSEDPDVASDGTDYYVVWSSDVGAPDP